MTTTNGKAIYKVWHSRGLMIGGATFSLLVVALLWLTAINISQSKPKIISFGVEVIAPEFSSYCPGEAMMYGVSVTADASHLPAAVHIVESWYDETNGRNIAATSHDYWLAVLRETNISAKASRAVPDLPSGVYWLDHVAIDGKVQAYTVGPVTIKDCK